MGDSCLEISTDDIPKVQPKEELQNEDKGNDGGSSPSSRSSPEANCPICLGKPENKSFTDSCLHQFCFTCLLEWSKVKAVCPLCKQSFKSIIHNVRSIEDYEQYYLSTNSAEGRVLGIIARLEPDQPREPFRYRTTAVSSYLDYFVRLEEAISHVIPSMPVPTHSSSTHWHRRRQHGTSDFRRNIYQQGLWVQPLQDLTGRVRDCSPEFFRCGNLPY
ncbi:hypothetical protein J6590_068918 [Homalodisca vitripennis]|nr:hypothetical protein J6590_068918 [Homalodisca vitripennis]